jgi:hypothetical protein
LISTAGSTSRAIPGATPGQIDSDKPLVYFGSFQDLLGRDKDSGAIKLKNEWLHTINAPISTCPAHRSRRLRLLTYQMPDELLAVAGAGEFDEFDLNEFFAAAGTGAKAAFKYKDDHAVLRQAHYGGGPSRSGLRS